MPVMIYIHLSLNKQATNCLPRTKRCAFVYLQSLLCAKCSRGEGNMHIAFESLSIVCQFLVIRIGSFKLRLTRFL